MDTPEDADRAEEGGELLSLLLRRRGWSAPRLSELTDGAVSASSVRAWAQGQYVPSLSNARSVAAPFAIDGVALLAAWGMPETADGLRAELERVAPSGVANIGTSGGLPINRIEYSGQPLSEEGRQAIGAMVEWLQVQEATQHRH